MRVRLAVLTGILLAAAPTTEAGDASVARDPKNFTWIEEGVLALGGGGLTVEDVDWLHAQGFRAIVDLRDEHQDPEGHIRALGMDFLDLPIRSASHVNATQLAGFVAWVEEQRAAGRPVYVHCTNGWHRAASFALAWEVAHTGGDLDEEARELQRERPGVVVRALSGLLDHEAERTGVPQLAVVLSSPLAYPEPNATMTAVVDVYANGAPAPGAEVKVWSEESRLRIEGTTGPDGRFAFTYVPPPAGTFMDHLYARASLEGHGDGADNVEFIFGQRPVSRGALDVVAERDGDSLVARATYAGKPIAARIVANAPGWTAFEASEHGVVSFPNAPDAPIEVTAVSWGAVPASARVEGTAPPPPPTPTPATPTPAPSPTPSAPTAEPPTPAPGAGRPDVPAIPPGGLTGGVSDPPEGQGAEKGSVRVVARELAARYAVTAILAAVVIAGYVAFARRGGKGKR